ncbi:MAG TPA: ABC transporter ATP-binding protein [Acidobacteriaceae bacterium]|nr:ABC transporter ATP-binding protein [Acidobacteriaceae bacterium]
MNTLPVIETCDLSKRFGKTDAVCHLTMSVAAGSITGFLGLNGAGKTTTIKMLLGMIAPTAGEGTILGHRIADPMESLEIRRRVAYVSESQRLYDYMTVAQMVCFTRSFYSGWRSDIEENLLHSWELPLNRKVKSLSKGMRRKLALLLAFARKPELLILDEPSDGLDPVGTEQLLETMVAQCGEGTAIFFSSHQIAEVERVADRVCMIHKGRLVMNSSLDDLRESYRQIDLVFSEVPNEVDFWMPGVERILARGAQTRVLVSRNAEQVLERARMYEANSIDVAPISLREIFLDRVKENCNDALV